MQKMMARKIWSIRIVNILSAVSFILWVTTIKYGYDFIQHANLIQDNMFNQSMYEFDMLDLDQYYNLYENGYENNYEQDSSEDLSEDTSEDYVSYKIT